MAAKKRKSAPADVIEVRGARQNNLKGVDLDIPLGQLTVVTGPSGSGKSSLAFQTVYAEGQRRYVETFSPYTRQFFDRMDKPDVDAINGIPPAIAIGQGNNVKTTRSTVGTITEINDYLKLLFPRIAKGYCPQTGIEVRPDTPASICDAAAAFGTDAPLLVTFPIPVPKDTATEDFFQFLNTQAYVRVLIYGKVYRTDEPATYGARALPAIIDVIQDRVPAAKKARLLEAVERALTLGYGKIALVDGDTRHAFTNTWHCPESGVDLTPPTPALFTFNSPLGACPECRGFGRVIGIDLTKAIPDPSLSLAEGAVKAFQGERGAECQADLERCARGRDIDLNLPFEDLDKISRDWVLYGEGSNPEELWAQGDWYGVQGFFDWLESKAYKMHVRVFLSRYRSYTTCRSCRGTRLQPQALNFKITAKEDSKLLTLPQLWQLPLSELLPFFESITLPEDDRTAHTIHAEIVTRLTYLNRVGLGYLDLDRPTRSLSGGEVQRVSLTTCLGSALTGTLFVLDEPSIGLHPRDCQRLIEILHQLRDRGNTLLVVEHEEEVIRAADYLVEVGPGRGEDGGSIAFTGPAAQLSRAKNSLTADYLLGRKEIPVPQSRRKPSSHIVLKGARHHNLKGVDVDIPLGTLCAITGVSGSGKSTLIHNILYRNLLIAQGEATADSEIEAGFVKSITRHEPIDQVIMVDQSPLSRTPRSNPAVYTKAFDFIRNLFAACHEAQIQGLSSSFFSFNSGEGRCARCWGNGVEKIEMQFLSDIYVTCPECEGSRYSQAALEIRFDDKSIADVLHLTVDAAITWLDQLERKSATRAANLLRPLAEVGLGYLRLGQPLNTLSGGESQRLKLISHLPGSKQESIKNLFIFDEPTTGLHLDDIKVLLNVFNRLVDAGHSILVIEHNLEVIKSADHLIDIGPDAGSHGGKILFSGTPEELVKMDTHTARALLPKLTDELVVAESPAPLALLSPLPLSNSIEVRGARHHNLKNLSLDIPREKMVVITGLSGSGKSTLAFDLIFAEGQRRFLDSMSTYARQFVEQMERPVVDRIAGLPPTVAIEQRISRGGRKSTVATVTEIYHFLRLLFAKVGTQYSPASGLPAIRQSETAIFQIVQDLAAATKKGSVRIMAPLVRSRKGYHSEVARWALDRGYETLYVDGALVPATSFTRLERFREHSIDAIILTADASTPKAELRTALSTALQIGKGTARILDQKGTAHVLSTHLSCPTTGRSFEELDPRLFSFNSPHGWCPSCRGNGQILVTTKRKKRADEFDTALEAELDEEAKLDRADQDELLLCPECGGARINETARHVKVGNFSLHQLTQLPVTTAEKAIQSLNFKGRDATIARDILTEIAQRLHFLDNVGLGYLSLDRSANTLSGGEAQRIRLAAQLGSNLRGVLYVLDEPTIGLHPRDNDRLLSTLLKLRDAGNSLLIVEHDEDTMRMADHIIDLGPEAGRFGGEIIAQGTLAQVSRSEKSITGRTLSHPLKHPLRGERRPLPKPNAKTGWIKLKGCSANNLKNVNVQIPLGRLTVLAGVSGAGKSSLMRGCLLPAINAHLHSQKSAKRKAASTFKQTTNNYTSVSGLEKIAAVYEVDQTPIGKTSRSTPATYIKVFDEIRSLFANLPEARMRGFAAGRFSFNTEGGRCETCTGNGRIKHEMVFLPTSYTVCEACKGSRFNPATLEVAYNGKTIADVMAMTVTEAASFFKGVPKIHRPLNLLHETGTGYLTLGQPSPTLSGGEAQRIKLVAELTQGISRSENARMKGAAESGNLYLIEEPTIGLHLSDVEKLIDVLHRLVDAGNTVVVIEHNLNLIAEADHLIDIGPEPGSLGGQITASGTPEEVALSPTSPTAPFLRAML